MSPSNKATEPVLAELKSKPKDPALLAKAGDVYYDVRHFAEAVRYYQLSLAQTLLNLGIIKWQAKMDIQGAVAAWQKLFDTNPKFEQAEQVKQMIAQAKQHAIIKPGSRPQKPI